MGRYIAGIGTAVAVLVLMGLVFGLFAVAVDASQECAITNWGEYAGVATQGLHFKAPWTAYHCYSLRPFVYETSDKPDQSGADFKDVTIDGQTSDGQSIPAASFAVTFRLEKNCAGTAYTSIGGDMREIMERTVKQFARGESRKYLQTFKSEELYGAGVFAYQEKVQEELIQDVSTASKSCVVVDAFQVRKIDFDQDYKDAVEAKQIAFENIQRAKNDATAAQYKAEEAKNLAKGQADAAIESARGEADSIRLRGEALRANPEVLQWQFVTNLKNVTWGFFPTDSITPFLPIPTPSPNPGGSK